MENTMTEKKRIIIIGAGPAGLTAAYELLKQSPETVHVTVLEADKAVGGIAKTVRYDGNRMDLGGHRFFSKDQRVTDWWAKLMPIQGSPTKDDLLTHTEKPLDPKGPDPEREDRVMLYRDRVSRIYYLRRFFDYPISLKLSLFVNMGLTNSLLAGTSYLLSLFRKLEESSLENFYTNRFGAKLYHMFFENYTEKLWGRHPSKISADWGAQRVKGLSVSKILSEMFSKLLPASLRNGREVETSLIEQFLYPKYGPGQMWEITAEKITEMGGEVLLNTEVVGFDFDGNCISAVCAEGEGGLLRFEADAVISSMPLKDLTAACHTDVPEDVRRIAAGLPYRDFITVGLQAERLKLTNRTKISTPYDRIPDCWIYVQEPQVKMGRIQIFNNWSPYLVKDFENRVSLGLEYFCDEGDAMWTMPDEAFIRMAVGELVSMGILESPEMVHETHIEHVRKAYPAYFDTYAEMDRLVEWLNGIENLYCVGRNGQHRYNNMDHSMATSFEAVRCLLSGSSDRTALWNVNTEKSYHETKEE